VNVASISGLGGDHGFNAYNAAKAAVVNYTRTLALDHARDNIRANAVCPGLVATRLTAFMDKTGILPQLTAAIPMQRIGQPEEIAQLIAFLASDEASYMTGSIVVADGGQTASNGNADLGKLLANLPPSVTSSAST
jgi:meso-butanediol dehydrogenase/(S,S)-butanediol dehydrogenase/diacetyl reductase